MEFAKQAAAYIGRAMQRSPGAGRREPDSREVAPKLAGPRATAAQAISHVAAKLTDGSLACPRCARGAPG
eukprot:4002957-Pyramimonas_sp.AAC.1